MPLPQVGLVVLDAGLAAVAGGEANENDHLVRRFQGQAQTFDAGWGEVEDCGFSAADDPDSFGAGYSK